MKVVIDIPENDYNLACNYPDALIACYAHYIKTGVPLPKKHGRLIDEDNVIDAIHERLQILQTHKEFIKKREDIDLLGVLPYISKIPTVIEAEEEHE